MRILIIEDEKAIVQPLKDTLEKVGFAVDAAFDGEQGLNFARRNEYDCILLDLNLPKVDGISVSNKLRERENITPVIMLTARSQVYDKLEGFDSGADDYVTKPFNMKELIARIKALIKRNSRNKLEKLVIGKWQLYPERNLVTNTKTKASIDLSNKETGVLEYLIRNKGTIVSTEDLLEHVWDSEIDTFTDTVKTHIKTLRKKVDPKKKLIRTVRGKGYLIQY